MFRDHRRGEVPARRGQQSRRLRTGGGRLSPAPGKGQAEGSGRPRGKAERGTAVGSHALHTFTSSSLLSGKGHPSARSASAKTVSGSPCRDSWYLCKAAGKAPPSPDPALHTPLTAANKGKHALARDLNTRHLFDWLLPRPSLHSDQMRFLTLHIVNNFHTCADLNYFPYHLQQTNSSSGAREPEVPPALAVVCAFLPAPGTPPSPRALRPPPPPAGRHPLPAETRVEISAGRQAAGLVQRAAREEPSGAGRDGSTGGRLFPFRRMRCAQAPAPGDPARP